MFQQKGNDARDPPEQQQQEDSEQEGSDQEDSDQEDSDQEDSDFQRLAQNLQQSFQQMVEGMFLPILQPMLEHVVHQRLGELDQLRDLAAGWSEQAGRHRDQHVERQGRALSAEERAELAESNGRMSREMRGARDKLLRTGFPQMERFDMILSHTEDYQNPHDQLTGANQEENSQEGENNDQEEVSTEVNEQSVAGFPHP